jgi:hypothetical protein
MRLNFFSRDRTPDDHSPNGADDGVQVAPNPHGGKTFPADEIVWGIVIRNGFDEMDDPWHHRGTTQHAYLEGNDNVAICGFRPPQSGPRTRRRSRLGLPSAGEHPMCGMCARLVVAPRPRVAVPVQPGRAMVPVPVARPVGQPLQPFAVATAAAATSGPAVQPAAQPVSPWVQQRTGTTPDEDTRTISIDMTGRHDGGLLERGVRFRSED